MSLPYPRVEVALVLVAILLFSPGCSSPPRGESDSKPTSEPELAVESARPMSAERAALHLASFDKVWTTIRDRHYDETLGGVDWEAVRTELRPRVVAATSDEEVRRILQDMISRLGLSHFQIIPSAAIDLMEEVEEAEDERQGFAEDSDAAPVSGESATERAGDGKASSGARESASKRKRRRGGLGRPGLDLRVLDGRAIVTRVRPGGPADRAGIRTGWSIVEIDGRNIGPVIETLLETYADQSLGSFSMRQAIRGRFTGQPGDEIAVVLEDADDARHEVEVELAPSPGKFARFGQIGEYVEFESRTIDGDIGYIRFDIFLGPSLLPDFQAEIEKYRDLPAPGVIVDIRGNPGGIGMFASALSGWFFENDGAPDSGLELGRMVTRDRGYPLIFSVNPRVDAYPGKVAVLVDGCSVSTSEIMAGGLRDLGRARVFGTRTAGAALPSVIERLPNGDAFQYAIANYISKSGEVLEGRGVEPQEVVELSREALLDGRDNVIEAAVHWIRAE
ncbi:MAG: hypothetical protein KDC38_07045 [Planctomycetes bacterium]|nr:hypothetical protein [Planctomycetota bacterium]